MESLGRAGCRQEQTIICQRPAAALPQGVSDASQGSVLASLGEALMTAIRISSSGKSSSTR